ncbi:SIR2 family protein, partial [Vibrio cholerae]
MENENIVRFLSSDIKRNSASSKREPIEIDLSNDDLDDELATFFRFINKVLDTDNLVILAGSGTSLTFNKPSQQNQAPIAPSMWHLWDYCNKADENLFQLVLKATNYDALQKHREANGDAKPDIELLLSLCDSSLAVGNLSNQRTNQVSKFLEQAKNIILAKTTFTESIPESDWVSHDKFMRAVGR